MATTTLWLNGKKAPDLSAALTILLAGSSEYALKEPPEVSNPNEKQDVIGLVPWFSLRDGAFATDLCALWKVGCRWFVLITPSPDHPLPWARFPAHVRAAFDLAIQACNTPSWEKLRKAIGTVKAAIDAAKSIEPWENRRVQEYVEARMVYTDLLSVYSHNSKFDLSNEFLAPARLLCLEEHFSILAKQIDLWKKVWGIDGAEGFQQVVLSKLPGIYGLLGKELLLTAGRITDGFTKSGGLAAFDLESLMGLLTCIRVSAGVRTHAGDSSGSRTQDTVAPLGSKNPENAFRILVVDDHAASWRPVFEKLQGKLSETPLDVSFTFSSDGKTSRQVKDGKIEDIHFSYYDLVILDVFLGGATGIELLKLLRRDFSQLPVLLWTTSRDEEITAEATLANGILLKKTVTWESLTGAVSRWVVRGKAMRIASLPNPFFNHTIQNLEFRQMAVQFHEWCLKQLDSFHALDGEYFRFFTDHGGRHIVKLWELLEHALQPFLHDKAPLLLPENDDHQRELEILGLYLTVICHELGMFPMRIGGKVENFAILGRDYLDDVRSLHAARGMVLLHDSKPSGDDKHIGQYWNDNRGQELGALLRAKAFDGLANRLGVLVGYHARLFGSLADEAFLKWSFNSADGLRKLGAQCDLAKRLEKLSSPVPSLSRTDDAFRTTYTALAGVFTDTAIRNRLRRQCALFRFVDALDITASRNPAEFLVGAGRLSRKDYLESLKRELCTSADIENGVVHVKMMPPAPNLKLVKKIIKYVPTLMNQKKDRDAAENAKLFLQGTDKAAQRVACPWTLGLESMAHDRALNVIQRDSVLLLQKPLDCWLTNVWGVLIGESVKEAFVKELKDMGILNSTIQEPTLVLKGAKIIASITALSVAGELLDEYQAIVEAGLSDRIQLTAPFGWDEEPNWGQLPDGLATLKKFYRNSDGERHECRPPSGLK